MSGSQTLVYTDADFRAQFPFFADTTAYPEDVLSMYFTMATGFMQASVGTLLTAAQRQLGLYLMTAHLQQLYTTIVANGGGAANTEVSATIDKISVTVQPPIAKTAFQQWLSQTPWGQQLRALLLANSAGGFFAAGRPELAAFRRVGGCYG